MFGLAKLFGQKGAPVFEGRTVETALLQVSVHMEGFDVGISSTDVNGEYKVYVRANGKNFDYPEEEYPKIFSLTKSDTQYNLVKRPYSRISFNEDYSRVAVGIVNERSGLWDECGMRPDRTKMLGLSIYVRDQDGKEKLWAIDDISSRVASVPKQNGYHKAL